MGYLGREYRDGKGLEKDLDKVAEYLRKWLISIPNGLLKLQMLC